ncbi:MAG: 50S ribosomal protein L3 [Gammaproteobacteria bacterium]|nr:MAG: 50S ribosomal protein L3 [Gammaproteobacteria bacterium]
MALGLIGRKIGMTRIYDKNGAASPVTVLEVKANRVAQVKNEDKDGYRAVQITVGERRPSRVTKAMAGHYAKANIEAGRKLWEFRLADGEGADLSAGSELRVDMFSAGQMIDIQGTTIGRGFAGVVKRHGFKGGRASHGNSLNHRTGGSIGQNQTPGRVFPGKKMSGHMGNVKRMQQNLEIVRVDAEKELLLVKGSIPGHKGADVVIRLAAKVAGQTLQTQPVVTEETAE